MAQNVLGSELLPCSFEPRTGFFRDGCCNTSGDDRGLHLVCVECTAAFLAFSKEKGNDLSTPHPEWSFPGLVPGDRWCVCLGRWIEALEAGAAPRVFLEATHALTLEWVDLATLQAHAATTES